MDAKEIKSCLKKAREAIRTKDFKEALNQCRAVLAEEKNNYNALIFIGVATEGLDQNDQALKAYKKAAAHNPDQLLAWQALGGMLDKNPLVVEVDEALHVFDKLELLNSSGLAKKIAYIFKCTELLIKSKDINKALEAFKHFVALEKDEVKRIEIAKLFLSLLSQCTAKLSQENLLLYKETLNMVLKSSLLTEEDILEHTERLLLLTLQTDVNRLESISQELKSRFPNIAPPIEYLLHNYLDKSICSICSCEIIDKITDLIEQLHSLKGDCLLVKVGKGFLFLKDRNFAQARDVLQSIDNNCICGLYCLSQAYIGLHMYDLCLEISEKGLAACESSNKVLCVPAVDMTALFRLAQVEAYRGLGTPEAQARSLSVLEEIQEYKPKETLLAKAHIYLDQGKIEEAENCIEHLSADAVPLQTLKAAILVVRQEYGEALKLLQALVKRAPDDADATLLLGKVLWELRISDIKENAKQECFTTLLKAAKLDPYNYASFLYLGYFYQEVQQDLVKAKRCFQKAYDLNPGNNESGCFLVDVLVELEEEPQSLKILESVTSKAAVGTCKWAWLRLGLYQIKHENSTKAIMSLQSALRSDPNDCHVWECLADAYLQRGSHTTALKAFMKASELDPQSLYCLHQIASIKHTLGSLSEAIQEYKKILDKSDNYVPALKGVGECLIDLGRHNLHRCLDGLAKDNFEEAIGYLTKATSQRPDLSCLWKLMGDASTFVYHLSADTFRVPSKLADKGTHEQQYKEVPKAELLQIGARCYSQAVKILPDSGALWHDLGVNLYYQSQSATAGTGAKEGHDQLTLTHRAMQAIKKAVDLEPNDWRHWNVLGVLSCCQNDHKPALAQHCFIRSIECEPKNVVAWTNLGALYLSKGETKLAHNAFSAAQSADPTYMACWIGQAVIAEIVGHEEAMDLFRHTTELGFHPESALGYGQYVLNVLGDASKKDSDNFQYCIKQMAAIPAASDALTRYTGRIKTNPVAYNMQGLLFEHQNLLHSSATALKNALALLEQNDPGANINDVQMNLARVLCKQGKYEDSVKHFELCNLTASVEHMCIYGLALFNCNKLVESSKVYQLVLELLGNSPKVSMVYTALGMVAYRHGDLDGAKSQLFDSSQITQPSPKGLLALCALGLLLQDLTLASAVFEELFKLEDKEKYIKDILLLQTYKFIQEGNISKAEENLRKEIQANPSSSSLCVLLAVTILTQNKDMGAAVTECALSALSLGGSDQIERNLMSLGQLMAGHHHRNNSDKNALKTAQKMFHLNPGCKLTLSTLVCAVHAEAIIRKALTGSKDLFTVENGFLSLLLDYGQLNNELENWCLEQLIVNNIELNNTTSAQSTLKSLLNKNKMSPEIESFTRSINAFLTSEIVDDKILIGTPSKLLICVTYTILCHKKQYNEAVTLLVKIIEQQEIQKSSKIVINLLERAVLAAFLALQDQPENASLKEKFDNVVKNFKDKEIPSTISHLLRALVAIKDNKRLAKHLLTSALDNIDSNKDLNYCSSFIRQTLDGLNNS